MKCARCKDLGWVCENHDDEPWDSGCAKCGGAGMPCKDCNPSDYDHPPRGLPGETTIWDIHRGWVH